MSSTPAGFLSSLRTEPDPQAKGPREGAASSDAAVTFASLLVSILGGGAEAAPTVSGEGAERGAGGDEGDAPSGEGAEGTGQAGRAGHSPEGSTPGLGTGTASRQRLAAGIVALQGTGDAGSSTPAAAAAGGSATETKNPVPTSEEGVDLDAATRAAGRRGERDTTTGGKWTRRADVSTGAEAVGAAAADARRGASDAGEAGADELAEAREASPVRGTGDAQAPSGAEAALALAAGAAASHAAASTIVSAAAAADVRMPDRAMEHLDPEMRGKVERVIERMASEHGTDVVMLEGRRSQDRQSWLYEQGRTRPGPVVTWTERSMHSKGLAADLKVEDPGRAGRPYEVLQRVASEEGLSVLGMKDPGHVELRTDGGEPEAGAERSAASSPTTTARIAAARVARAATPAQAHAARAAGVAQVARPAHVAGGVARTAQPAASAAGAYAHAAGEAHARPASRAGVKPAERLHDENSAAAPQARPAPAQGGPQQVAAPGAVPAQPMERIEKMVEAMESRDAILGPGARRVSVRLDGTAGPVERVQVQMLDRALRSQVTVDDGQLAQRLKDGTSEILRTLERGGYDARAVDVRSTGRVQGTHEALAAATRNESVAETVRTLFASDHGAGRDGQNGRGARGDGGDARRQDGAAHHSRRDDRRKDS